MLYATTCNTYYSSLNNLFIDNLACSIVSVLVKEKKENTRAIETKKRMKTREKKKKDKQINVAMHELCFPITKRAN